jgi:chromosome segregation ATPase
MTWQGSGPEEGEEQLADALAQIESLQAAAADAEARAATARSEAEALKEDAAQAKAAREAAETEASQLRADLEGTREEARAAAARYRKARLDANPDVPGDLVPEAETVEDVDRQLEAALKVVGQVRERVEEEQSGKRGARVPAGSPARRPPDLSGLPSSEKIRLGLQQLSGGAAGPERQAR